MNPPLPPKELVCDCGNRFISQQHSNWCRNCGRQVFYDPRDKAKSRLNTIYFTTIIVLVIGFLTYFFIEMILTPVLSRLP